MEKDYDQYKYDFYDGIYGPWHPPVIRDLNVVLDTYTNWNSSQADKERTIFGAEEKGLFYNYSDRLYDWDYDKAKRAYAYAAEVATPKTGAYYTAMLSYFHDGAKVDLRHIIAGCNRSNGYPYLVFGYICDEDVKDAGVAKVVQARKEAEDNHKKTSKEFTDKFDEAMAEVLEKTKPETK